MLHSGWSKPQKQANNSGPGVPVWCGKRKEKKGLKRKVYPVKHCSLFPLNTTTRTIMATAEKATLVLGGAALGAASFAAYQKFTQKPLPPAIRPSPIQTGPSPPAAGNRPSPLPQQSTNILNNIEKAREILPFGFPGPANDLVYRNAYVTSFNRRDRNPNWVAEHLTAAKLKRGDDVDRQKSTFKEDDSIPPQFRAKLNDYFRSGFDRGHMVPAADVKNSQVSMNETFYLTNISPQVGEGFNRDCKSLHQCNMKQI